MSASGTAGFLGSGNDYLRNVRILRYAAGTAITVTIAQTFAWDLAYLMPVLALSMLASRCRVPGVF